VRLLRDLVAITAYGISAFFARIGMAAEVPQDGAGGDPAGEDELLIPLSQNGHQEAEIIRKEHP
jgi:hypothetical protein